MALIEEISLDTLRPTQFISIRLQQNDALDRKIDVQITEGSDIYTIPTSGAVISLRMVKPDGNPIDNICEVINNKARFTITEQMTVISGRCSAQIKITNSSTGGILKTVKFNILIDEEVINDSMIVSTGEFTALQAALLEVGDITNKVDKSYIANNLITDEEGFVLDARQGKELKGQVDTINNNLAVSIVPFTALGGITLNASSVFKYGNVITGFISMTNTVDITSGTDLLSTTAVNARYSFFQSNLTYKVSMLGGVITARDDIPINTNLFIYVTASIN